LINKWLVDEGFLTPGTGRATDPLRGHTRRLARRLGITDALLRHLLGRKGAGLAQQLTTTNRVDWIKTLAYSNGDNAIQINLAGREPHGIVQPETEYREVMSQVVARLQQLRDPETGNAPVRAILTGEQIAGRSDLGHSPDIVMLMSDEGYGAYDLSVGAESVFRSPTWRMGAHRMEGILIAAGRHFKRNGEIGGARIIDLAPTILHMMGLPIPSDMDGRVLAELFLPGYFDSNPLIRTSSAQSGSKKNSWNEKIEFEEIARARLRGLGYLN
jgi:predicted AlkP superfamily phosphohydrolase/phosphomutase